VVTPLDAESIKGAVESDDGSGGAKS
jgi:hypothetical protein